MRAPNRAAAKHISDPSQRLDSASRATGKVISPGKFEIDNPALLEFDLWDEMNDAFNPSYQLSLIHSQQMELAHDQENMAKLTEQLRALVTGTRFADC
jgi:hypothetical protein